MATQPDDDDVWLHGEAVKKVESRYANQIFVQPYAEGMIRINLGDMFDPQDPVYHTSIMATPELALQFADVIRRVATASLQNQQEIADAEYEERKKRAETPATATGLGQTIADLLANPPGGTGNR